MLRRSVFLLLAVALLAALYVGMKRSHYEAAASQVEIAMDWSDFDGLARSYDYDERAFLVALRRAGLTSLAVAEELGSAVNSGREANLISGVNLLNQARLGGIADPILAQLVRQHRITPDAVYLTVFTPQAQARYLFALGLHFDRRSIQILHARPPYLIQVRTQPDYLAGLGLGLPETPLAIARDLHFFLVPRLQNDERFGAAQIDAEFRAIVRHERVSTVIFFGLTNEVLGYPDHIADTAAAFRSGDTMHRSAVNFGSIETYDAAQVQKGNEELARQIVGKSVRVQAIAKAEQDKLDFEKIVARYLLGARERNVRLIYLRPLAHQNGAMSIQKTNIELVRRLREGLQARGLRVGRATPIPPFRVNAAVLALITLAVPAVIVILLDLLGRFPSLPQLAMMFIADLAIFGAGAAVHREVLACKLLALIGAIAFATLAVVVLAPFFQTPRPQRLGQALWAGLRVTGIAVFIALGGALLIVGLVSTPLTMEEIDRFTGVKAILLVPPLLVLAFYLFTRRFGTEPLDAGETFQAPVRVYQLVTAGVLLVAGVVYLARSGNQSDITPSAFELALRSQLTTILSVRPRFKEFLIGFPTMMLLPNLAVIDRRRFGWLLALALSIGTSDVVDTFSHLHTGLTVSFLRIVNGLIIGLILGVLAVIAYRRWRRPQLLENVMP